MASTSSYFNGLYKNLRGDGVFQATTNLIDDPEDLTTANWTGVGAPIVVLSDYYINGKRFTKVQNTGANLDYVFQILTDVWTTLTPSFSVIIKKGAVADNKARFLVTNPAGDLFRISMDFDNYPNSPGTPIAGTLHDYTWFDSETVELRIICDALGNLNDDVTIYCFGGNNPIDGEYTYWTAVQAEDLPYPTPYVNGTRAVVHPDVTFRMPSKFTIDMIIRPWFIYDTANDKYSFSFYIDNTHKLMLYYRQTFDVFQLYWIDGVVGGY